MGGWAIMLCQIHLQLIGDFKCLLQLTGNCLLIDSLPNKKGQKRFHLVKRAEKMANKQFNKIIQKVFVVEKVIKKIKEFNGLLPCKF